MQVHKTGSLKRLETVPLLLIEVETVELTESSLET